MASRGLAAYVVGTADAHNSEYIPRSDARREWLTGFTGSAGTAVVTHHAARLWTDGRYYLQASCAGTGVGGEGGGMATPLRITHAHYHLQAERELDATAGWQLMRDRLPETPTIEAWLSTTLKPNDTVGLDPYLFTVGTVTRMQGVLASAGVKLDTRVHDNLVDAVWGSDKPSPPATAVSIHDVAFAGASWQEKVAALRSSLATEGAGAVLVTALDEVAWLFNIRGADVECNPVTIAYAVVTASDATLCIDAGKLTPQVRAHLDGVTIRPYGDVTAVVGELAARGVTILMDPAFTSHALYTVAVEAAKSAPVATGEGGEGAVAVASTAKAPVLQKMSPLQLAKAVKNEAERKGFVDSHLRDGVALTSFFAWLEAAVMRGVDLRDGSTVDKAGLTEHAVSEVLESFRRAQDRFVGLSFPTIAGAGPNGAIIHYRPSETVRACVRAHPHVALAFPRTTTTTTRCAGESSRDGR